MQLTRCLPQSTTRTTCQQNVASLLPRIRAVVCRAAEEPQPASKDSTVSLDKQLSKLTKQTATTFAPRASGKTKNPAVPGSLLYNIFEWQAWLALAVGGLLSFNIIYPTDEPSIARLMGMWSIWMFTIPSLRAKECKAKEKDALNLLFVLVPLINVILPFVWKSFPFIYVADVVAVVGVYAWKGVWAEQYGIPLGLAADAPAAASSSEAEAAAGDSQDSSSQ